MVTKKTNIIKERIWLGPAFAFAICVAVCSLSIFLGIVGAGEVTSLFCTPREALTMAGISGLVVTSLFMIGRRIKSSKCECEDKVSKPNDEDTPIACDLTVFSISERIKHLALAKSLLQQVREVVEHDDGFTFVFEKSLEPQVVNWISKEKRCCPFFSFELARTNTPPLLNLKISGPPGAKEILRPAYFASRN
jgi:hypothetical protein